MGNSYVVTGGGRGVGRAIVERLAEDADSAVVIIEMDDQALDCGQVIRPRPGCTG